MYSKTSVDILIADIYNDTYTKTEIDSTLSAYTNSIDLHNGFYSKAKMSIMLDTYCNMTGIQANYYDKGSDWLIVFEYRFKQLLHEVRSGWYR